MTEACLPPPVGEPAGLGGELRRVPDDFVVEEIPLVRPAGHGDHVHFQIEKRGMSTFDLLLRLSKGLKVSERTFGYAGLKDARALTRQWVSLRRGDEDRIRALRHPRFRVLGTHRHTSPLKLGHHRGNRFAIRIRDVDPTRIPAARQTLERLVRRGMPNGYGEQRFGTRLDGHEIGRAIVNEDWGAFLRQLLGRPSPREHDPRIKEARAAFDAGDLEAARRLFPFHHRAEKRVLSALLRGASPREAFETVGRRPRRIWIAALQSHAFNRVLARRIAEDTQDGLVEGDIAALHDAGALFEVTAADVERVASSDAVPTGPLVGYAPHLATGAPGRMEREVLADEGLVPEAFAADHVRARGQRRPFTVPLREASLTRVSPTDVVLRFVLPPGAFATVLLHHLMAQGDGVRGDG